MNDTPLYIHSNAPWIGSGYGGQAALFGPRLNKSGYRVAFGAFAGLHGSWIPWKSPDGQEMIVYPGGDLNHGNDVIGAHAQHWFQGDPNGMTFLISDPWVIEAAHVKQMQRFAAWMPIDHDPLLPITHKWLKEGGGYPIAMSLFGKQVMEEAGHTCSYSPHAFDPTIFQPVDRNMVRKALGIPESAFVVGMVAANQGVPSRKCFGEALSAFSVFQRSHPDALLYLHTKVESPHGEEIPIQIEALKLRAMVCDQYGLKLGTPPTVVAATMCAFDVLLGAARGEGFGVPLVEAQAVGTPCIVTDFSSMPEVAPIQAGNWAVGGQEFWTNFHSYQLTPNIGELIACLEECYAETDDERNARRKSVCEFAHANYQVDYVMENFMLKALEEAQLHFGYKRQLMVAPEDM